jgi:hypothetical protein
VHEGRGEGKEKRGSAAPAALPLPAPGSPPVRVSVSLPVVILPFLRLSRRLAVIRLSWLRRRLSRQLSSLVSGAALLHEAPPSLAQARENHRQAAAHYSAPVAVWARLGWGWLHLALKCVLHTAEWLADSPARLLVAALAAGVIWHWS